MTQQKAEKATCKSQGSAAISRLQNIPFIIQILRQSTDHAGRRRQLKYTCRFFLFVQLTEVEMPGVHCQPNSERPELSSLHDLRFPNSAMLLASPHA
ncbi:hypothetical protein GQ55_1G332100 [Panicum hallii var. hallii]|uniref:Uncharacterized protein n=1 Tax=Panicum hallii var. hallii TaxID=1504633 RepID=A0A2T7FA53_9POAL|nr:hypothetical protein GQ55_1G332100 [Panicum hallii var. hallii]